MRPGWVDAMRFVLTFVEFKRWMSERPSRDFIKRGRDRRQAEAVQQLIDEGRLKP